MLPENTAGQALRQTLGFEPVRRRLGRMIHGPQSGQRRGVILLERPSDTIGI